MIHYQPVVNAGLMASSKDEKHLPTTERDTTTPVEGQEITADGKQGTESPVMYLAHDVSGSGY